MFISFEGIDGSGKSTQAKLLVEKLRSHNYKVEFLREPGGTEISERIREILLDKKSLKMTTIAELLLFSASRSQLVSEVIIPALSNNIIIICDRFVDSTTVYQGYGRGIDMKAIQAINSAATLGVMPHCTFLIDVSLDEIFSKRNKNNIHENDRMENSGREFYEKVQKGYKILAEQEKNRFVVIDGEQSIETIHQKIWEIVQKQLAMDNLK